VDTSTLRWILIVVGVIIVVSIFFFGSPEKKRKPKASRRRADATQTRREPTLSGGQEAGFSEPEADFEVDESSQRELDIDAHAPASEPAADPAESPKPAAPLRPAVPPPDRIVSLFLLARDNHVITGADLLQATVNTGMDFGEMNIFHRLPEGDERPIFSLANAAKPGHFERDEWNTFETGGVVLFMTLPGPVQALDAWDSMLATARRIGEILHAELLDEERNSFTRQKEAQLREQMREYDRRHA
jgi:cell division protein ZipA